MNCPICNGTMIGIGAPEPESCAEFACDTCNYVRNLNDEFVTGNASGTHAAAGETE